MRGKLVQRALSAGLPSSTTASQTAAPDAIALVLAPFGRFNEARALCAGN